MNTGKPSPLRNPHVQRRALKLIGEGKTTREAADELGINLHTLSSWLQRYEAETGPIAGRRHYGEVPDGMFDGTSCARCGLSNPHVCLPVGAAR